MVVDAAADRLRPVGSGGRYCALKNPTPMLMNVNFGRMGDRPMRACCRAMDDSSLREGGAACFIDHPGKRPMTTCKLRPGRTRPENIRIISAPDPGFSWRGFQLLTDPPGDINMFSNIRRVRRRRVFSPCRWRVLLFTDIPRHSGMRITCCFDNALCRPRSVVLALYPHLCNSCINSIIGSVGTIRQVCGAPPGFKFGSPCCQQFGEVT